MKHCIIGKSRKESNGMKTKAIAVMLVMLFLTSIMTFVNPVRAISGDYWTSKAPLPPTWPGPYRACAGAAVNDRIYVIGGYGTYGGWTNVNQEYNPATDTWTTKAPMPAPRGYFGMGVVNNKIYAIGGWPNYATNEEYNPATNTWTTKAPMPTTRWSFGIGVVYNKIYAIGGWPNYATNEEYNPATNTWTTRAPMFTPRGDPAIGVVNDKIYAIAGWTVVDGFGYGLDANEEYTPPEDPKVSTQGLIETIRTWNLPKGTENSLTSKLQNAIQSLENGQQNAAINKLNAFINEVKAQRNKKLTNAQADALIAEAQRIISTIQG
jgi:hypothetical protein